MGERGVLDKNRCFREDKSLNLAERHSKQMRVTYGSVLNTQRDAGWGWLRGLKTKAPEQRNNMFRCTE